MGQSHQYEHFSTSCFLFGTPLPASNRSYAIIRVMNRQEQEPGEQDPYTPLFQCED